MGRINFTLCAGAATNRCSVFSSSSLVSFIFVAFFSLVLFFMYVARATVQCRWLGINRGK